MTTRIKDDWEMEEAENEFGSEVVQCAGQYVGKTPVKHWRAQRTKRPAIDIHGRQVRRTKQATYRAEKAEMNRRR